MEGVVVLVTSVDIVLIRTYIRGQEVKKHTGRNEGFLSWLSCLSEPQPERNQKIQRSRRLALAIILQTFNYSHLPSSAS